jgi:hypothetical protein
MVSVDSLNLDVLELIFAYLSGNDLLPVALVNRSFLAGVIPRLYRTLIFRLHHSKRYPKARIHQSIVRFHVTKNRHRCRHRSPLSRGIHSLLYMFEELVCDPVTIASYVSNYNPCKTFEALPS